MMTEDIWFVNISTGDFNHKSQQYTEIGIVRFITSLSAFQSAILYTHQEVEIFWAKKYCLQGKYCVVNGIENIRGII